MQRLVLLVFLVIIAIHAQAESKIVLVKEQLIPRFYSAPGYIAALNTIDISSSQTGYINQLLVEEGDVVEKNQLLLVIDEVVNKHSIEQVKKEIEIIQSTVSDATKDVKNYEKLKKNQSVSEETLRKSRLVLSTAQNSLLKAKSKLAEVQAAKTYLRVKSPVKALIVKRQADIGDLATPGSLLLTLEAIEPVIFETSIPAQWLSKLTKGQTISITLHQPLNDTQEILGEIIQLVNTADPLTQQCRVKIKLSSSEQFPTGVSGQAQFLIDKQKLLTIPEKALVKRVGITAVFRIDKENRIRFTPVRYGKKYLNQRVILAGLYAGDRIITLPSETLRDGMIFPPIKNNLGTE